MLRHGLPAIVFLFLSIQSAFAYEPVVMKEGVDHVRLGPQMDYLEDANGEWSIEDVSSGPVAEKFKPLEMAFPNFGLTRSAYWFKFEVVNSTNTPKAFFLEQESPWMTHVDIYIERPIGGFDHRQAGSRFPFHQREIEHNHFLFKFDVGEAGSKLIFARLETNAPFAAPLNFPRIDGQNV